MRKLKGNLGGGIPRLRLAPLRMTVLCVSARRYVILEVVAAAASAADSLVPPLATMTATSLRCWLHFHRGADLDVIVK